MATRKRPAASPFQSSPSPPALARRPAATSWRRRPAFWSERAAARTPPGEPLGGGALRGVGEGAELGADRAVDVHGLNPPSLWRASIGMTPRSVLRYPS